MYECIKDNVGHNQVGGIKGSSTTVAGPYTLGKLPM